MTDQRLNISVDNGKYTVIMEANGRLHALRYGQPWQDLSGNNLVYYLAAELGEARERIADLEKVTASAADLFQKEPTNG